MRKVSFLVIFVLLLSSPVFAHPPSDIKVTVQGSEIRCEIAHSVADPAKHFIYEVVYSVNGVKEAEQKFDRQFDRGKQVAVYKMPSLKKGDKLTVMAECNKGGDISKEVIID